MKQRSEFIEWLIESKNFGKKGASDVYSRCVRAEKFTGKQISKNTLELLSNCDEFDSLSIYVKSQIKRAIMLWNEFNTIK